MCVRGPGAPWLLPRERKNLPRRGHSPKSGEKVFFTGEKRLGPRLAAPQLLSLPPVKSPLKNEEGWRGNESAPFSRRPEKQRTAAWSQGNIFSPFTLKKRVKKPSFSPVLFQVPAWATAAKVAPGSGLLFNFSLVCRSEECGGEKNCPRIRENSKLNLARQKIK